MVDQDCECILSYSEIRIRMTVIKKERFNVRPAVRTHI